LRDKPVEIELLLQVKGIQNVFSSGANTYKIENEPGADVRAELFKFATDKNLSLIGLKLEETSLEAVFKQLTSDINPVENA